MRSSVRSAQKASSSTHVYLCRSSVEVDPAFPFYRLPPRKGKGVRESFSRGVEFLTQNMVLHINNNCTGQALGHDSAGAMDRSGKQCSAFGYGREIAKLNLCAVSVDTYVRN